ncbi:hypothetical protein PO903_18530 [Paenibacillus sp. PK4536]|uniref:hypothetical protein n=1 Tax=Paenibacillus sp. PK4536 TaxID=3024576 RepID=UPI002358745C|nr:hypothetical protein [Paenibacillus sp. PK4536]WIM38626.1 hypothetical protein PO903_18530 [Paenibacillus sp. PK4536]
MRLFIITCCILVYSLFLIGCNANTESTACYAAIINYNNQQYLGGQSVDIKQYTNIQPVGEIVQRVDAEVYPSVHLMSNAVDKGTKVFETSDHNLLIKQLNGEYQLFFPDDNGVKG